MNIIFTPENSMQSTVVSPNSLLRIDIKEENSPVKFAEVGAQGKWNYSWSRILIKTESWSDVQKNSKCAARSEGFLQGIQYPRDSNKWDLVIFSKVNGCMSSASAIEINSRAVWDGKKQPRKSFARILLSFYWESSRRELRSCLADCSFSCIRLAAPFATRCAVGRGPPAASAHTQFS